MNLLDQIKDAEDLKTSSVTIEEWGVEIPLKEPPSGVRSLLTKPYVVYDAKGQVDNIKSDNTMLGYAAVAGCVLDETGKRMFKTAKEAQSVLAEKSDGALAKLMTACGAVCGSSVEKAKKK